MKKTMNDVVFNSSFALIAAALVMCFANIFADSTLLVVSYSIALTVACVTLLFTTKDNSLEARERAAEASKEVNNAKVD